MHVLLPPPGAQLAGHSLPARKQNAAFAPLVQRRSLQQPLAHAPSRCGAATSSLRHHLRCRASNAPEPHPDWPRNPERFTGLRDEDIIELEQFLKLFQSRQEDQEGPGEVHLVGTGPGDPGLLTLRALQLMQTADVVLYDRLVSDDILRLIGPQARMVYVGKHSGFHTRSQDEIHSLLLAFAEAGATVIRLKGGDPYIFGRGGEEVQYLEARGIQVHCVPGITAASGICAELGIPMTHRGVATSVRFLTGHARDGDEQELLDSSVAGAADPHTTLVVYMGLQTLPRLYEQLAAHGMPSDVPAVAVERGTTRKQRVAWGTVGALPGRAVAAGLKSPTLIIVGQVVALAPGWQQWNAAGQPIFSPARLPRHNYALPSLDTQQLQQCAAAATFRAANRSPTDLDEGIRVRDVPPAPLPPLPAQRGRYAAADAASGGGGSRQLAPSQQQQQQSEQAFVLEEGKNQSAARPDVVVEPLPGVHEAGVGTGLQPAGTPVAEPEVGGCGEDDACPLPGWQ